MEYDLFEYRVEPDVQEPRRIDPDGESWFSRQTTGTKDLVNAFGQYVSTRKGSFERLLGRWVSDRLRENFPVNLEDPGSTSVPPRLKRALQGEFIRVRAKRKK